MNKAIGFLTNNQDESDLESSSNDDEYDLAMLPPIGKSNAEADMGSDVSDDMDESLVHPLSMCLLNLACGSSLLDKQNKEKAVKAKKNNHASNKKTKNQSQEREKRPLICN